MTTISDALIVEGVALAFTNMLAGDVGERILSRIAELRAELLTTKEAAELLRVSPKTLRANHVAWKLDKSVALGADEPRFYRAQIMAVVRAREVKGGVGG